MNSYTQLTYGTNYGNDVLNIGPYCYIGYIRLGNCLHSEHVQLSHLESHVQKLRELDITSFIQVIGYAFLAGPTT